MGFQLFICEHAFDCDKTSIVLERSCGDGSTYEHEESCDYCYAHPYEEAAQYESTTPKMCSRMNKLFVCIPFNECSFQKDKGHTRHITYMFTNVLSELTQILEESLMISGLISETIDKLGETPIPEHLLKELNSRMAFAVGVEENLANLVEKMKAFTRPKADVSLLTK